MNNNTISVNINGKILVKILAVFLFIIGSIIFINHYNNKRLYSRFLSQHQAVETSKVTSHILELGATYVPGDSAGLQQIQSKLTSLSKQLNLSESRVLIPFSNTHIVISDNLYRNQAFQEELHAAEKTLLNAVTEKKKIIQVIQKSFFVNTVHQRNDIYLISETFKAD